MIGRNGAGKTTLLRMLNGLIKPDEGRIEIKGRIGALIALGAGFNPILTGRENIYVNASVLGLSNLEITAKIEEIIDFAEIGEFIDMPVQSYSSGMVVRLGFAVASSMNQDVMLLDEVLAVGDAGFRAKCYSRIDEISKNSAIIFVSHSMPHIARMCDKAIFLTHGLTQGVVSTQEGIMKYELSFNGESKKKCRIGIGGIILNDVRINCQTVERGKKVHVETNYGSSFSVDARLSAIKNCEIVVDVTFHSLTGEAVAECNNFVDPFCLEVLAGKPNKLIISIERITLNPGVYQVGLLVLSKNMLTHYDWLEGICELRVCGNPAIAGQQLIADWKLLN